MVGGEACDGETGEAVAEAAFEDEAAYECGGRGRGDFESRRASARFEQLSRGERGVALAYHSVVVRGVADAVVEQVARERLDARAFRHLHGLVNVRALPTPARASIETELVIRIRGGGSDPGN